MWCNGGLSSIFQGKEFSSESILPFCISHAYDVMGITIGILMKYNKKKRYGDPPVQGWAKERISFSSAWVTSNSCFMVVWRQHPHSHPG
jgi:hypothetical protein